MKAEFNGLFGRVLKIESGEFIGNGKMLLSINDYENDCDMVIVLEYKEAKELAESINIGAGGTNGKEK